MDSSAAEGEQFPDDVGELLVIEQRCAEGALGRCPHDAVIDMAADPEWRHHAGVGAGGSGGGQAQGQGADQRLLLRRHRAEEAFEGRIERLARDAVAAVDRLLQLPVVRFRRELAAGRQILAAARCHDLSRRELPEVVDLRHQRRGGGLARSGLVAGEEGDDLDLATVAGRARDLSAARQGDIVEVRRQVEPAAGALRAHAARSRTARARAGRKRSRISCSARA